MAWHGMTFYSSVNTEIKKKLKVKYQYQIHRKT